MKCIVIIFANEKARKQLLEHHLIATFRLKPHKVGKDWANAGRCKPKLVDVAISFEKRIEKSVDLKPYVHLSGFDSLEEWVEAIRQLVRKKKYGTDWKSGTLYLVANLNP